MRLGLDRLGQPRLDLGGAPLGDDVALAVRPLARLDVADHHLAVAGQPAEGRVDLAERQRLAAAEERVVVALEVVAVARLPFEQAEQGEGNAHGRTIHRVYTPRTYTGGSPAGRVVPQRRASSIAGPRCRRGNRRTDADHGEDAAMRR